METKIINNRLVKIWASSVDAKAMQQIENLTTLPFLFHHLAIHARRACRNGYAHWRCAGL